MTHRRPSIEPPAALRAQLFCHLECSRQRFDKHRLIVIHRGRHHMQIDGRKTNEIGERAVVIQDAQHASQPAMGC